MRASYVLWNKRWLPVLVGLALGSVAILGFVLILSVTARQEPRPAWAQGPTENIEPRQGPEGRWHPKPWVRPANPSGPPVSHSEAPTWFWPDVVNEPGAPYLRLRVNQTHDWVDACTTFGATVQITVTEASGYVKGTASGVAQREDGCISAGDFDWGGGAPDIVAGDHVDGTSSDGSAAAVTVITITGQVDTEANTLSGQVLDVDYPAAMKGEIWEEGATWPEAQTDDQGYFTLDFNPFDIQPGMEAAAWYIQPDGNWVGTVFLAPHPPGPVQAAINAAEDGDTVVIPPGIYTETINFNGKDITLRSEDPDDPSVVQATVLDGGQDGSVVTFESGETSDAVLEGFSITNGLSPFGGGISILNASPTITNNIVARNGGEIGGGIYVEGDRTSPVISDNRIADNIATEWGGGIAISKRSSPLVQNNVVRDNLAMEGAGIEITDSASPVIENNAITGSWAGADMHFPLHAEQYLNGIDIRERLDAFPSFGAGILIINHSSPVIKNNTISDSFGSGVAVIHDSSPRIEDNTISGNLGENLSGGILVGLGSSPQIFGNQITENSAKWGGGIQIFRDSSPIIQGNTIMANSAEIGGGGLYVWDHASPVVTDNTLGDNQAIEGGAIWIDRTSSILDEEGNPLDLDQLYIHIEETDESFTWSGNWESDSGECYSGGTRKGSGEVGAEVEVPFTGTGVALIYMTSDDHGVAEVEIDDVAYPDIDMYASEGHCQVKEVIATDLAPSEHTLAITVSGRKNPSSSNVFIVVDAINVMPSDLPSMGGNVVLGSVYVQPPPPWSGEPGSGRTLLVPADYLSIQAAIDSAEHGDTVVVAPGTYQENIDFRGKEIILRSQNPDEREIIEATIIEAKESYPVVNFGSGETTGAMLEGFTIRNTLGSGAIWIRGSSPVIAKNIIRDSTGAGIFCGRACSSVIQNNVIQGNTAEQGGGVNCYLSSPTIEDNTITNNKAGTGAGIYVWFSSPSILGNTISQNEVTDSNNSGGGIFLDHFSMATVKDNIVRGNKAGNTGGGIYIDSSSPTIDGNIIVENQADAGGGVHLFLNSSPDIRNNIIADNMREHYGAAGIDVWLLCSPSITHNTIANDGSSGQCSGIAAYGRSTISVTNTILWNEGDSICVGESGSNVAVTHSNIKGRWPGEGNISQNPRFRDPANGDYHLGFGSPAIDAGADTGLDADFEGDPRPFDGDGDGIARYDMGADEWVGAVRSIYLPLTLRNIGSPTFR